MAEGDAELLVKYLAGDVRSLEALVHKYRRQLFAYILNMTGNTVEAEDIFQEVWLKAIKKLDSYRHENFLAWLTRIARNHIIDRWRSQKPVTSLEKEVDDGFALSERLPGDSPSPGDEMARSELVDRVRRAIDELPAAQKEVVLMRIKAELPFKEIARIQRVPLGTALARMQYGLVGLRKILQDDYKAIADD